MVGSWPRRVRRTAFLVITSAHCSPPFSACGPGSAPRRLGAVEGVDAALQDGGQPGQLVGAWQRRPLHPFGDAGRRYSHGVGQLDALDAPLLHQLADPHPFTPSKFGVVRDCLMWYDRLNPR